MKIKYILLATFGLYCLSSCIEDKGSYGNIPVNEVSVSGLEKTYSVMSGITELNIEPTVKGTILGEDDSQYEYTWYACKSSLTETNHEHTILGNERNLNTVVDMAPGTYQLYLLVNDTSTGQEWIISDMTLNVQTSLTTGFYLFGDKEDGTVGMDFLSMPASEGDTTVIKDIFTNEMKLRGAQDLLYTGYAANPSAVINLWAITESGSYKIENSIQEQNEFDIDQSYSEEVMLPSNLIQRPAKILDQFPHQAAGGVAHSTSYRGYVTEDAVFSGAIFTEEAFKNPVNRYSTSTTTLYKPYKKPFYKNTTYISAVMIYDLDNEQFVCLNSSFSFATYSKVLTEGPGDFTWKQNKRTIVYGTNTTNYSYAIMKDTENNTNYYLYVIYVGNYLNPTKMGYAAFTTADAPEFNKASQYAISSEYPIILYSVDNKLYKFNYETKTYEVTEYDGEITYLTFDDGRSASETRFIVCTYNPSAEPDLRGTMYEYHLGQTLTLDPVMTGRELDKPFVYHTSLKIKKAEYRNSSR